MSIFGKLLAHYLKKENMFSVYLKYILYSVLFCNKKVLSVQNNQLNTYAVSYYSRNSQFQHFDQK